IVAVALNSTSGRKPAEAVASCGPATLPSVQVTEAWPSESVTLDGALIEPPPAVTVQVTLTPEMGLPKLSLTTTASGVGNVVPAAADCRSPATAFIASGPAASTVKSSLIAAVSAPLVKRRR